MFKRNSNVNSSVRHRIYKYEVNLEKTTVFYIDNIKVQRTITKPFFPRRYRFSTCKHL